MAGISVRAMGDMEAVGVDYLSSSDILSSQQRFRPQIHNMEAHRAHTLHCSQAGKFSALSLLRFSALSASLAADQPACEGFIGL